MEKAMKPTGCRGKSPQRNYIRTLSNSKEPTVQISGKEHRDVGFVLVHVGAGYHSESKAKEYKHVCKRACQKAMERLRDGAMAVEAVTAALIELEDSPFTNAGTGSNLNLVGDIECDASIMEGKSLDYGAVGALSEFSLSAFKRNKRKMEMAEKMEPEHNSFKRRRQSSGTVNEMVDLEEPASLDTVGAVVVDQQGNVAAAVSSGGLAMKHPGRVGQAAQYGCGCWAENARDARPYSTAVSTSGCGEHLMRTMLARECSTAMQADNAHQALLDAMQNKFIGSPFLAREDGVLGGIIVLRCCRCGEDHSSGNLQALLVEFLWTHTTESMCVGYMSANDRKARAHISRLPPGAVAGQSLAIEGGVCRLGGVE
ncbi:threonine aspartase 1 isoform X4 [Tachysurus fulvidraco]|uniref:threonine aspartase 1 isoform X4 n=1 Tax=Tachysurus fulvidraco TaxID=1234273 RepID=UPI001FEEE0CB|nr:threonine aspartase 1 isoform X4 [Tachysurus fulvidraco]